MTDESPADRRPAPAAGRGPAEPEALIDLARARTPARILVGRAGGSYRTSTQLDLRQDHAAAVDAVHAELVPGRDWGADFVERWGLFEVRTRAATKAEYLARPDLGRRLDVDAFEALDRGPKGADLLVFVGDGLSAAAVAARVPELLPLLDAGARRRGWRVGRPFFVRHCRVGVLNDVGDRLEPTVAVLLIGERPGLVTAESLSAYMAFRPRSGQTDAHRNLISNIHPRGTPSAEAAGRILRLAEAMMTRQVGGVALKEEAPGVAASAVLPTPPGPDDRPG